MVVSQSGSVEQTNHYYPYGALFTESTNGDVQRFKYNGLLSDVTNGNKELDRKFGLNWYDHGARHNDAAIGRWHSMDPLAEKHPQFSPYSYCMGDPVNLGDFNGMIPDSLEAALLSQDAYNPNFGEGPGKWSCISRSLGGSFKWAIYTKGEGDEQEYVLAFAGSDDFYDYLIDIYQGNGNIKGEASEYAQIEYGKAIKLAAAFVSFINEKEGTIVGHSLGASLGSLAAMASNTQAVVFNPAAIHDNTISTFGIDTSGHEKMIATYVVRGELITYINGFTDNSKTYGTIKPIEPKSGLSIGDRHRISNIINTFNRNGHKL